MYQCQRLATLLDASFLADQQLVQAHIIDAFCAGVPWEENHLSWLRHLSPLASTPPEAPRTCGDLAWRCWMCRVGADPDSMSSCCTQTTVSRTGRALRDPLHIWSIWLGLHQTQPPTPKRCGQSAILIGWYIGSCVVSKSVT